METARIIQKINLGNGRWEVTKEHVSRSGKKTTTTNVYVVYQGRFVAEYFFLELVDRGEASINEQLISTISAN